MLILSTNCPKKKRLTKHKRKAFHYPEKLPYLNQFIAQNYLMNHFHYTDPVYSQA